MDSAVRPRPNFYELLGVKPTASTEEIQRAFAREVGLSRPRAFGGVALLGLAFETLRNPAKRAAYDESIGLRREPPPPPKPYVTSTVFFRPTFTYGASLPIAPPQDPEPDRPKAAPEAPLPAFLAAPRPGPAAAEPRGKSAAAHFEPKPAPARPRIALPPVGPLADWEPGSFQWNRPVVLAGGLLLAVAILGGWAGSQAGRDAQAAAPTGTVTAALPKAATPSAPDKASAGEPLAAEASAPPPRRWRTSPARTNRSLHAPVAVAAGDGPPEAAPSEQGTFAQQSIAQAGEAQPALVDAPAPAASASTASLPLPERTVARTISRIGYSCGTITSTVASGTPGVFTVTCSSGQSFQARPVGGRYRFRRLGGH